MKHRDGIFILGAGRVGLGLAMALEARGLPVLGLWNRSAHPAEAAAACIKAPVSWGTLPNLSHAALIIVAVTDSAIADVGDALRGATLPASPFVVAHTSGCLAGEALGVIPGAHLGSLHPLLACPTPQLAARDLPQAHYVLEGDAHALAALETWMGRFGAPSRRIEAAQKPRYHAAAVMASNLVVALLQQAEDEASAAGIAGLGPALCAMALGAVQQASELGTSAALTGPVLRGDAATVGHHMAALSAVARPIYQALSHVALRMAQERGLPQAHAREVEANLGPA